MIRCISFSELDVARYDACIAAAHPELYSAYSYYLRVCHGENWHFLIYKEYEAVLPVPFVKKGGLHWVIRPVACQQLGVFSRVKDADGKRSLVEYLLRKFPVISYPFFHLIDNFPSTQRTNYIVQPAPYTSLVAKYAPQRRNKLKKAKKVVGAGVDFNLPWQNLEPFVRRTAADYCSPSELEKYITILKHLQTDGKLWTAAFVVEGQLANVITVYHTGTTAALLGTFAEKSTVHLAGNTLLIDAALQQFADTHTFDFEGSDIPSVAEFFKGFGAVRQHYYAIQQRPIEAMLTFIKRKLFS